MEDGAFCVSTVFSPPSATPAYSYPAELSSSDSRNLGWHGCPVGSSCWAYPSLSRWPCTIRSNRSVWAGNLQTVIPAEAIRSPELPTFVISWVVRHKKGARGLNAAAVVMNLGVVEIGGCGILSAGVGW